MKFEVAPNPFDNILNIRFNLKSDSKIVLRIADVTGKLVLSLDEISCTMGENSIKS